MTTTQDPPAENLPKKTSLLRSSTLVGSMTFISRISGFVRDMIFANLFGADAKTDAFFVAFKIPNFLRRLFGEGAFSQAFVPVFNEYKQTKDWAHLKDLINRVAGTFAAVLLLVTTLGMAAAPLIVMLFAPGFVGEGNGRYELTVDMLRITFPYLFFISLTAFAGGILNSYNRFAIPAVTPVLLNLSLISCALFLGPLLDEPVFALAWGVFIAGIIQFLFQIPFLQQLKLLPKPKFDWCHEGVKKILNLMLPALFGSAVVQINLLVDTLIASFLVGGSVSWLYYSDRLVEFPIGVFGVALATVILPSLSQKAFSKSPTEFSNTVDWGLRLTLLVSLPATVGLVLLGPAIYTTLFQYGEFNTHDTHMASISLAAYALGLPAFIAIKILSSGFFARQNTRTPVRIGIIAMSSNMVLNVLFILPLLYWEFDGAHAGLALATAASAWLQAFLLYRTLRKDNVYNPRSGWTFLLLKTFFACAMMAAIILFCLPDTTNWTFWLYWQRGLILGGIVIAAAMVYFASLYLVRVKKADLHET